MAAPHGVRGLVRIRSFTEDPMAIALWAAVGRDREPDLADRGPEHGQGHGSRPHPGVEDRTAAEGLRGLRLHVARSVLPQAGAREWYEADLIGLAAVGRDGRDWGKVMGFHDFGAGLTMEVSGARRHAVR
ncbi:MAG: hypothetical protein U1E23_12235 [Reyranellaceae bacterium]